MSSATESPATDSSATESQGDLPQAGAVPPIDSLESETPIAAEKIGAGASAEDARAVAEAARETAWEQPSFAKGLYLGSFDLGLIHPWPAAKADDVERGEAFMAQLTALCRTMSGRVIERDAKIPDEYLKALADLGVFGMKIPQEYGGLGLSLVYYGRALGLLGSVHPSLGALLSAHQSIGVPEPVKVFGTAEQKREYLPRCAAGAITAFLLTEPDVGSDPARMGSTAVPTDDGEAYILDGVKLWTTNGVIAELVVVMAVVPRAHRLRRHRPQGRHHRLRGGDGLARHHRGKPECLHGPARHRERRHPLPPGPGSGGQQAGPRGPGPEDRAHHAQYRTAFHSCPVRRHGALELEDRPRMVQRANPVGAAGGQA